MDLHTALMTTVALMALMTGLGFIFNLLLLPIKKDISSLEGGQSKLEKGQVNLEKRQVNLEKGQLNLEKRLSMVESKLDQLLARIK